MVKSNTVSASDPFFEKIHDGQWNACVGIQGNEQNYVDGYIEAALEIVSAVLDKKLVASRDTLAMPILYNARHAVELSLKFAINHLYEIDAIASTHVPDHDILSHWEHLNDSWVGDIALRQLFTDLEPYVVSLAKIDEDGQELRYPTKRGGKKSLENIAVVNLPLIRKSLESMSAILTSLKFRVIDFSNERGTGSQTKACSREDLKSIAAMLGDHTTWKDDSFNDKKDTAREKFGLSSHKFSDAVDKIRNSRPLATLVGIETPLTHLEDEKAIFALKQWAKANPITAHDPDDLGTSFSDRDWQKIKDHQRITKVLVEAIENNLSNEDISDIEVLFYIGRNGEFGEHYDDMLAETIENHKQTESRREAIYHIMTKTSLLENVIAGSKAAGRPSLALKLQAIRPA